MQPTGNPPPPGDGDDIFVVGVRFYEDPWWYRWGLTDFGSGYFSFSGVSYIAETDPFIPVVERDEDAITIDVAFSRPLTAVEQRAIDHLKQAVAADKATIVSLPDGQQIRMYDGSIITKAELLARYTRMDIRIDDNNYSYDGVHLGYANNTTNGEVVTKPDGDIELHMTIKNVVGYDNTGGLNYLLFHEIGHTTPNGVIYNGGPEQETYANDVSWAMAIWRNEPRFNLDPNFSHYSSTPPVFLNGGGGGGGGPHNPGSDVPDPDNPFPPIINYSVVFDESGSEVPASGPAVTVTPEMPAMPEAWMMMV